MQNIIPALPREAIKAELNANTFVRKANFGARSIYIVDAHNAPNTLREVGRLRELSFRAGGGGTGADCDLDRYDGCEKPFKQLIVWSEEEEEIVGGYRFQLGEILAENTDGHWDSPTAHLFHYNTVFTENYLPHCVELGRSFVVPSKQAGSAARGSIYTLDNLWDGLGAIIVQYPQIKYFFGKVTMYPSFPQKARDLILYFMRKYCPDAEGLMQPHEALNLTTADEELAAIFVGENFKADYKILSRLVRDHEQTIPPLVNAYMKLSPTMKSFGTAINHDFGNVEETGILITIADIYEQQRERHLNY
jgi:hypothetical protein